MPGIGGVPFGSGPALTGIPGMPGVIGTGLPDRPGGMFAGSRFISELTFARVFEFALADEFAGALPHARINEVEITATDKIRILAIPKSTPRLK